MKNIIYYRKMTRTPIIKQEEYLIILRYFIRNENARSYHLTNDNELNEMNNGKTKANFSMKLQNLLNLNFITKIKEGSRGRHGKYSEYSINWKGIIDYIYLNYIPVSLRDLFFDFAQSNQEYIINFFKNYIQNVLNRTIEDNKNVTLEEKNIVNGIPQEIHISKDDIYEKSYQHFISLEDLFENCVEYFVYFHIEKGLYSK